MCRVSFLLLKGLWNVKKISISILFIIPIFIVFTTPFLKVFQFEPIRNDLDKNFYIKLSNIQEFQIIYTHSIHLTDVIESYEIEEDDLHIRLLSMKYSDVAIGMPAYAEEGQTLIYEDGFYKLQYDEAILEDFNLYIGDVDYNLKFKYEAKYFDLKKVLGRGETYNFSVQKISLFDWLKGEKVK